MGDYVRWTGLWTLHGSIHGLEFRSLPGYETIGFGCGVDAGEGGDQLALFFLLFFFFSSHLEPMDLIITILPVVTKDLPISPRFTPYNFFIAMQVQHSYNSSTNG